MFRSFGNRCFPFLQERELPPCFGIFFELLLDCDGARLLKRRRAPFLLFHDYIQMTFSAGEMTMSRTIAKIEEMYIEDGVTKARVVDHFRRYYAVALTLMLHAHVGDEIVIESGLAVENVTRATQKRYSFAG